jgi:hypothetical protein
MKAEEELDSAGPWLIGGNSRCGKTTLVNAINSAHGPVAGLPVEGLMVVFLNRWYLFPQRQMRRILEDYLSRNRFVDEHRKRSQAPQQFLATSFDQIIATMPEEAKHQIEFIAHALDVFAVDEGRPTWAVCDVNSETRYGALKRHIPDLKLVLMVRDPRASLCHSLHWNTYPKRIRNADLMLRLEFLRWGIAYATGLHQRRRHPRDVHLLSFDDLVNGDAGEEMKLDLLFGIPHDTYREMIGGAADYAFEPDRGWLTPDGARHDLLTEREVAIIEYCLIKSFPDFDLKPSIAQPAKHLKWLDFCFAWMYFATIRACPIWPEGVRIIVDTIYHPWASTLRRLRILKTIAIENSRALRA